MGNFFIFRGAFPLSFALHDRPHAHLDAHVLKDVFHRFVRPQIILETEVAVSIHGV